MNGKKIFVNFFLSLCSLQPTSQPVSQAKQSTPTNCRRRCQLNNSAAKRLKNIVHIFFFFHHYRNHHHHQQSVLCVPSLCLFHYIFVVWVRADAIIISLSSRNGIDEEESTTTTKFSAFSFSFQKIFFYYFSLRVTPVESVSGVYAHRRELNIAASSYYKLTHTFTHTHTPTQRHTSARNRWSEDRNQTLAESK